MRSQPNCLEVVLFCGCCCCCFCFHCWCCFCCCCCLEYWCCCLGNIIGWCEAPCDRTWVWVVVVQPLCAILECYSSPPILAQFILDCTSLNLPDNYRIPAHNPNISLVYKISRDWTFAIGSERLRLLKQARKSKYWQRRRHKLQIQIEW